MSSESYAALIALGAIWGSSYLFIRVAAPVLGPPALMDARVLLAGVALLIGVGLTRRRVDLRSIWREWREKLAAWRATTQPETQALNRAATQPTITRTP